MSFLRLANFTRSRTSVLTLFLICIFAFIAIPSLFPPRPKYTWKTFSDIKDRMDPVPCAFCPIAETYPFDPTTPVPHQHNPELIHPQTHLILNTKNVMAFLDIMPITEGHVLVISRQHREKLYDLKPNEGAAIGSWLPLISSAVMRALGRPEGDWNVVQNNGVSAAQVVPHVHYHIIPRSSDIPDARASSWRMFGKGQRTDLDDSEGVILADKIRKELQQVMEERNATDPEGFRLLGKL